MVNGVEQIHRKLCQESKMFACGKNIQGRMMVVQSKLKIDKIQINVKCMRDKKERKKRN